MNIRNSFGRHLTGRLLVTGIAWLSVACLSASAQLSDGSSDRTDNSFAVPGWFSKDKSDIARYPVPLLQPQTQQADSSPLVVIQKGGTFGNPGVFSSKTIYTPTPFGYVSKGPSPINSVPWATPGVFGGYGSSIPYMGYSNPFVGSGASSYLPSYSGYRYGFGGGGAPYMQSSGFNLGGMGFGYNKVSTTIVVPQTKSQGTYYNSTPTGNSGSNYYSSNTPLVQPNPVTIPPKQSPKEYWGESGNPFGGNLNSTPW
jgi:hypothetical protein